MCLVWFLWAGCWRCPGKFSLSGLFSVSYKFMNAFPTSLNLCKGFVLFVCFFMWMLHCFFSFPSFLFVSYIVIIYWALPSPSPSISIFILKPIGLHRSHVHFLMHVPVVHKDFVIKTLLNSTCSGLKLHRVPLMFMLLTLRKPHSSHLHFDKYAQGLGLNRLGLTAVYNEYYWKKMKYFIHFTPSTLSATAETNFFLSFHLIIHEVLILCEMRQRFTKKETLSFP